MSTRYKSKVLENFNYLASERSSRSGSTSTSSKLKAEEQLENISPYMQRQLEILGGRKNTKILVREKQGFGIQAVQVAVLIDKLSWRLKNWSFKQLFKPENPLVFTQCPRCDYVGLNLLTTSTKEQFSPTFNKKIKHILPSSKTVKTLTTKIKETPPLNTNSQMFLGKASEKIPILNISKMKARKNIQEGLRLLDMLRIQKKKSAFEALFNYQLSVIEYDSSESEKGVERKYTFGYVPEEYTYYNKPKEPRIFQQSFYLDYPSPTLSQKTAFKILYSRIKKVIFRRKLKVFISLSKDY